jgi:tRNA-intron endonuclease
MTEKTIIYEDESEFYSNTNLARALLQKSKLGEEKESRVIYSFYEVLYLLDIKKAELFKGLRSISFNQLLKNHSRKDKNLKMKYLVFKDLKNKGYILKAGLKFGADFRCYEKGQSPGKNHAKYLLYIVEEKDKIKLEEFCSKARVSHSTGKSLLMAVIDSEKDITYFEVNWKKP